MCRSFEGCVKNRERAWREKIGGGVCKEFNEDKLEMMTDEYVEGYMMNIRDGLI